MFARASESWTGFCTNGDVVLAPGTAMQVNADAPAGTQRNRINAARLEVNGGSDHGCHEVERGDRTNPVAGVHRTTGVGAVRSVGHRVLGTDGKPHGTRHDGDRRGYRSCRDRAARDLLLDLGQLLVRLVLDLAVTGKSVRFTASGCGGSYAFHCTFHSNMHAH